MIGGCLGDDRGKCRMNWYCKLDPGLLLAYMNNTVANVLTAYADHVTAPLPRMEKQRKR